MTAYKDQVAGACAELNQAAAGVDAASLAALADVIAKSRRIACHGLGREGLMMRALAMRLHHLGLEAHVVGDMSLPPVGAGDLLLVSAGPGDFDTIMGLVKIARHAGAATACVTAQGDARVPSACDHRLVIPAQTMANDQGPDARSVLPMGSVFEGAMFVVFEILVLMLKDKMGVSAEAMRARHTNLE